MFPRELMRKWNSKNKKYKFDTKYTAPSDHNIIMIYYGRELWEHSTTGVDYSPSPNHQRVVFDLDSQTIINSSATYIMTKELLGRGRGCLNIAGMKIQYDPRVTDLLESFRKFFTSPVCMSYRWRLWWYL